MTASSRPRSTCLTPGGPRRALDAATRDGSSALGATSMYWHVKNKDELLDLALDRLFGEIEAPGPELAWRDQLRELAHGLRRLLLRHRNMIMVIALPTTPTRSPPSISCSASSAGPASRTTRTQPRARLRSSTTRAATPSSRPRRFRSSGRAPTRRRFARRSRRASSEYNGVHPERRPRNSSRTCSSSGGTSSRSTTTCDSPMGSSGCSMGSRQTSRGRPGAPDEACQDAFRARRGLTDVRLRNTYDDARPRLDDLVRTGSPRDSGVQEPNVSDMTVRAVNKRDRIAADRVVCVRCRNRRARGCLLLTRSVRIRSGTEAGRLGREHDRQQVGDDHARIRAALVREHGDRRDSPGRCRTDARNPSRRPLWPTVGRPSIGNAWTPGRTARAGSSRPSRRRRPASAPSCPGQAPRPCTAVAPSARHRSTSRRPIRPRPSGDDRGERHDRRPVRQVDRLRRAGCAHEPVAVGRRGGWILRRLVPRAVEVERTEEPIVQRDSQREPVTRSAMSPRYR